MFRRSLLAGVLLYSFCLTAAVGQSLQSLIAEKLHPAFQALVAGEVAGPLLKVTASGPSEAVRESEIRYDVIITTTNADAVRASGIHINSVIDRFATAVVTRQDLVKLIQLNDVAYLDPGSTNYPMTDLSVPETGANLLQSGFLKNTRYTGKGVIVVIYDTGIDWKHLDFRDPADPTKSRILAIWDQSLSPVSGESSPGGFSYGVEYTKQQIEAELGISPPAFVREIDMAGHGTHVAGTAAGNGASYFRRYVGMAPEADIIVVKGGDESFSESKMIDGLTYAAGKASGLGKPVVVNWSIGGHAGPHDGTRAYELKINDFVKSAGRVVTVSAGNEGDQIMHIGGTISSGGTTSISVKVPSLYTPKSGTDNDKFELDVWFNSSVSLTATVTSPNGITYSVNSSQVSGTAPNASDGTIELFNQVSSLNQNRAIQLFVRDKTTSVPKSGTWTLSLSSPSASAAFDAWLSSASVGDSTVTIINGNANKTVAMPATAEGAITVASYVTKWNWTSSDGNGWTYNNTVNRTSNISDFSSIGPTADGRQKPDLAAPGQGIASSLSSAFSGSTTRIMPGLGAYLLQGTSMASPHVAGAAALLLQISPSLSAQQIKSFLTSTAATDSYTTSVPNVSWGYGKMDVLKAAVQAINSQAAVQRQTVAYDNEGANQILQPYLTGSTKYALRFTPAITGQLTGMQVNLTTVANRPLQGTGPLVCEVWSNVSGSVGGIPGSKLGTTVLQPFARLSPGTNNYVDMTAAGVTVAAGQDYQLVISVSNPQDTVKLRTDNVTPVTNRSSYYDGASAKWINLVATNSGANVQQNIRIRAMVTSVSGLVSVEPHASVPNTFELQQNYPNPFNPTTTIRYSVPVQGRVRLRVFDLIGREVAALVDEDEVSGNYVVDWHGTDNFGSPLASGVYFYKLEGSGRQVTKKMLLLK